MITGFNTDVKHNAMVYHVQTEDKGRENPKIETLVYVGGEILDNTRSTYEENKSELSEDQILALLERQHQRVIRDIKLGKYDEQVPFEEGLISGRGLEEVIAAYLSGEPCQDFTRISANGLAGLFKERTGTLQIDTVRGETGEPIEGAYVRVKLRAPGHRTHVLGSGSTGSDGRCSIQARLPRTVPEGAHMVLLAVSDWGVAEHKVPLQR